MGTLKVPCSHSWELQLLAMLQDSGSSRTQTGGNSHCPINFYAQTSKRGNSENDAYQRTLLNSYACGQQEDSGLTAMCSHVIT